MSRYVTHEQAAPIIANLLKDIRQKKLGISINKAAKLAGLAPGRLSRLENGLEGNPSLVVMTRLADAYNIPVEVLSSRLRVATKDEPVEFNTDFTIRTLTDVILTEASPEARTVLTHILQSIVKELG